MNPQRYVTTKDTVVPKGVVLELTQEQAKALGDSVKTEKAGLRNDLHVYVDPADKTLPQEEE